MFCPNFKICMGCFVHVILLGVGCFVSLQKNMWWFLSTYNKMDMGGYVHGVFCPYTGVVPSLFANCAHKVPGRALSWWMINFTATFLATWNLYVVVGFCSCCVACCSRFLLSATLFQRWLSCHYTCSFTFGCIRLCL